MYSHIVLLRLLPVKIVEILQIFQYEGTLLPEQALNFFLVFFGI